MDDTTLFKNIVSAPTDLPRFVNPAEGDFRLDTLSAAKDRGNPAYLADPVSRRDGDVDGQLRSLLLDTNNWYLPKTTL